jgi:hypothetical protein
LLSTVSTIVASEAFDLSKFQPELNDWVEKCKAHVPNYEKADGEGAAAFGGWYKSQVAAKKAA